MASYRRLETAADSSSATAAPEWELLQRGFRYAFALTHHRQDAEDLTHEAWVNLCRRYGQVNSRAALFTAIRHLFIDRCRRARVIVFDPLDDAVDAAIGAAGPALGVRADLERLLAALRPGEREVVYLHYVEGRTAEEVGQLTRQPRGTVLSLLHRALQKLRRLAAVRE